MIFCISNGFDEDMVYDWNPFIFKEVYQSLRREEGRSLVTQLYLVNQANHGTKETIGKFADALMVWAKPDKQKNERLKNKFKSFLGSKPK